MKWVEPQTRMLLKAVNRNYDIMSPSAQKSLNWLVLGLDIAAVILLFSLL